MVAMGANMVDNKSSDAAKVIKNTFEAFVNLLKEFPRSAGEDFIYDDSTLKKITRGNEALNALISQLKKSKSGFSADEKRALKEPQSTLSRLMEEMPLSPEDEFLYDSEIHQLVMESREAVVKLGNLFS
jgi:hypothetical protein